MTRHSIAQHSERLSSRLARALRICQPPLKLAAPVPLLAPAQHGTRMPQHTRALGSAFQNSSRRTRALHVCKPTRCSCSPSPTCPSQKPRTSPTANPPTAAAAASSAASAAAPPWCTALFLPGCLAPASPYPSQAPHNTPLPPTPT